MTVKGDFENMMTRSRVGMNITVSAIHGNETKHPITGSLTDPDSPTTYTFKARVEVQNETSPLVKEGSYNIGDAKIFAKAMDETDTYRIQENDTIAATLHGQDYVWRVRGVKINPSGSTIVFVTVRGILESKSAS